MSTWNKDRPKVIGHEQDEQITPKQESKPDLSIVKQWCIYTVKRLPGVLYCEPPEQSTRVPLRRLGWRDTCLGCQVVTMMLWALMIMMMPWCKVVTIKVDILVMITATITIKMTLTQATSQCQKVPWSLHCWGGNWHRQVGFGSVPVFLFSLNTLPTKKQTVLS